jgi:hypothetical protein
MNSITRKSRTRKSRTRKSRTGKSGKRWVTAIEAASKTLDRTGSILFARKTLRRQALINARKLFGSVGEKM